MVTNSEIVQKRIDVLIHRRIDEKYKGMTILDKLLDFLEIEGFIINLSDLKAERRCEKEGVMLSVEIKKS